MRRTVRVLALVVTFGIGLSFHCQLQADHPGIADGDLPGATRSTRLDDLVGQIRKPQAGFDLPGVLPSRTAVNPPGSSNGRSVWDEIRATRALDDRIDRFESGATAAEIAIKTNQGRIWNTVGLIAVDTAYTGGNKITAPLLVKPFGPGAALAVSAINSVVDQRIYGTDSFKARAAFNRNAFVAGMDALSPHMTASELQATAAMARLNSSWNLANTAVGYVNRTGRAIGEIGHAASSIDNARFLRNKVSPYLNELHHQRSTIQGHLGRTISDSFSTYRHGRTRWPR